jgi:lipopolysaccharide transport system permease protein
VAELLRDEGRLHLRWRFFETDWKATRDWTGTAPNDVSVYRKRKCFDATSSKQQFDVEDILTPAERALKASGVVDGEPLNVSPQTRPIGSRDECLPAAERPPVLIIENRNWTDLELRELWTHRDLFYLLAWRDVKVRYKQTVLGAAWAIVQPLLTMIVFTLLFGKLARVPSEGQPYAIFSYAGLLPWNFFVSAVTNSSNSLVNSTNLITKVYFPRLLVPTAAVGAALVDITIASLILLVLMPIYSVGIHASLILYIPLVGLTALTAAAVGIWTSAINVKYRDVRYALPFAIQILMFLTPVIYPVSFLPDRWRWALRLNPLSGIIEGFRDAIFGRPFNWNGIAISAAITLGLLAGAAHVFRRMEGEFADVI